MRRIGDDGARLIPLPVAGAFHTEHMLPAVDILASYARAITVHDPARHHVTWDGKAVSLTVTEFLLLEALAARPGVIKSRNQLMDAAYTDDVFVDDRTVDSHIKALRRKIGAERIRTVHGVGYALETPNP